MRIIARPALVEFWEQHPDAKAPLEAWYHLVRKQVFASPHDLRSVYASASFLGDGLVVFNVGGNKHRLVARVRYDIGIVFIRWVLTHRQYDEMIANGTLGEKRGSK